MTVETGITVREVAELAQALTDKDALEQFVNEIDAEQVPLYLARLTDAATNIRALVTGLEQRLVADERVGDHFTVDGVEYGFFGAVRKGYEDFPGLVRFLIGCGISPVTLAEAVSDARVTSLRSAASSLTDEEKRGAALAEIESHRVPVGARGAPRFQLIDKAFMTKPATNYHKEA